MATFKEVLDAIQDEMNYQDNKWGADKQQSLPGYILIMENELRKAGEGWMKDVSGRNSALSEIMQVVTVGVRCLQQYGLTGWAISTDDISMETPKPSLPKATNSSITVTLLDGSRINIDKTAYIRAYHERGSVVLVTTTDLFRVRETVKTIQQMMQD